MLLVLLALPHAGQATDETSGGISGGEIVTLRETWTDAARSDRSIPVTIRHPRSSPGSWPLIVFSHGLGGTRDGYVYLAEHWARQGYLVVSVQHIGSDDSVWRGKARPMDAMVQATRDPDNILNRPRDVSFVIDRMLQLNADPKSPFHGRVAVDRIGVAGHSFGAYTTLAVGGQALMPAAGGKPVSLVDSRVKAIIPMSAPADAKRAAKFKMFEPIAIPALHMTGTKDDSPVGGTSAAERRIPFDQMHRADNYLLTFKDGDHAVFSDHRGGVRARTRDTKRDRRFQRIILESSTRFWDAYLRNDADALRWLKDDEGFRKTVGDQGTVEVKPAAFPLTPG